ncbi:hypothetical protein AB0D34_23495 [Streptomyces sp. NPDC048420]|uniref:hypothetical protein n=1 Tax=Streptomyces sp. NPDC048420 TaxID=3155755 RepID=UPI00343DC67E
MAHVEPFPRSVDDPAPSMFAKRRLVCRNCGLSRESKGGGVHFFRGTGQAVDPYFHEPLFLQTETRHGWLWAYNPEHLELIRQFVQASLREHAPWHEPGRRMTAVARLPTWIKRARNRAEVLRAIERIRASLME